jgi:phytoene dehydrogenase-like protein
VSNPLIILGGGLSGLAAGIRYARFGNNVLILEQHSKLGGLNSYYRRRGILLETGLHAITNYAPPGDKRAPLNRLFRQLKLPRREFITHEQLASEVVFPHHGILSFTNDFSHLTDEIARLFPQSTDRFLSLVAAMDAFDPLSPKPWISARKQLNDALGDELLIDYLFCPLMFYGSSQEYDMDFSQFVILFRSIFQEGFFRPEGSIKDFLAMLREHYLGCGGELRLKSPVDKILTDTSQGQNRIVGVRLQSGEVLQCDRLLSTIGLPETLVLLEDHVEDNKDISELTGRLSFMESVYVLPQAMKKKLKQDRTIIFFNTADRFQYRRPEEAVDLESGVICFPNNFKGLEENETFQLRVTHIANYDRWLEVAGADDPNRYQELKTASMRASGEVIGKIVGNFQENIVYEDSFTPLTIERFTSRRQGAVYGSPYKIKDGRTDYENLFLAGTDQGFLGIIGSMLSGVSMVNRHLLI